MGEQERRLSLPNGISGRPTSLPNGVTGRRVSFASGGPGGQRGNVSGSRGSSKARGSLAGQGAEEGMAFDRVCVDVKGKRILWDVSGRAPTGQLLAVMGPSGAGKTTLLNTLAGYTTPASGRITFNQRKLNKKTKRKISYVLQADIFFPNLTLRETLRYSALIRLPSEISFREKLRKVEEIITILRLEDCANTYIGNALVRGLSGGEKKRANIGCEMLTDPSLILLDEPTSGLDSTSALSLLELLKSLLSGGVGGKTIVTSIHQPSSQMYYMFDGLLLLAKGKVAYFGPAKEAMNYFASVGLRCDLHYNPADYMMDLVTSATSRKILIGDDPKQENRPKKKPWWRRALQWCGKKEKEEYEVGEGGSGDGDGVREDVERGFEILEYPESPRQPQKISVANPLAMTEGVVSEDVKEEEEESIDDLEELQAAHQRKWATPWWWQVAVLTVRTFRQSRHTILSKLNLFLAISLSIVAALVWFQIPMTEESIVDRYGLLFFTVVFWGFNPLFVALTTFPAERVVINKERSSGSYHLSAYYLAKTFSELPLIIALPSIYIVIVYWAAGLNGWAGFFGSWFVLLLNGFLTQSFGLMMGATIMDAPKALTVSVLVMLTSMLLGGFYVRKLPFWLTWAENLSFITFAYDAMLRLEFTDDQRYTCGSDSSYAICNTTLSGEAGNVTIPGTHVFSQFARVHPLYVCIVAMICFSLTFRTLAYLALRFLHRP